MCAWARLSSVTAGPANTRRLEFRRAYRLDAGRAIVFPLQAMQLLVRRRTLMFNGLIDAGMLSRGALQLAPIFISEADIESPIGVLSISSRRLPADVN